ncbi:deoxycytidylate deaminase [Nitrosopumilus sp. b1]|nr:deoxycytidylate deaminase [Nitrosopumilus sp. b1]
MKRPSWDEYFMIQAEIIKLRSNCIVNQTGAVIVQKNLQIATGYSGTPPGIKNCFEGGCKKCTNKIVKGDEKHLQLDRCTCTHAEANAIIHCSMLGIKTGDSNTVLYSTFNPCRECIKMAITVGIRRFVCYDTSKINYEILEQTRVEVTKLDKQKIQYWVKELMREYEDK